MILCFTKSKLKDQAKTIFERTPHRQSYARFKLDEKGHCPLLTQEGWCNVYIQDGEEHLPFVCKTYPRLYDIRGINRVEHRLTLGCPEAVRQLCFEPDACMVHIEAVQGQPIASGRTYFRPHYYPHLKILISDILTISDASFEESLYTVGLTLSSLIEFEGQQGGSVIEAIEQARQQVTLGYPRMLFQQQTSSFMYQSVFFGACIEKIEYFLATHPNTNRRLHALMKAMRHRYRSHCKIKKPAN